MKKNYTLILIAFFSFLGINSINAQTTIFSQNFASGIPATWQNIDNSGGGSWAYSTTATLDGVAIGTATAANGYAIFNADLLGNDGFLENADLITPSFSCAGQSVVNLNFQNIFTQYSIGEGTVAVSVNNGVTWTTVFTVGSALASGASNGNPDVQSINISAIAGNQANVKLRFKYTGDWDYWWIVDDISVVAPAANDVAITNGQFAEYSAVPLTQVVPYSPSCQVTNLGSAAATNVSVTTKIYNGLNAVVYTGTASQASLASGAVASLTSNANFTPTAVDFYLVEFIVSMTQTDANSSNDTFYSGIDITDSIYARDFYYLTSDQAYLEGPWYGGTATTAEFGNKFRAVANTNLVSATALFGGSYAIGDQVQASLYNMSVAGLPTTLVANSNLITIAASDTPAFFLDIPFPANTALTAGTNYFLAVKQFVASADRFALYGSSSIYTPNTSFIKVGTGAWFSADTTIGAQTMMIRANVGTPVTANCAITAISAGAQTACNSASNTYTQAVTVTYTNGPAGNIIVNGQSFPKTTSPQTVILTGLVSNGAAVNVTASFSATPTCTLTSNALFTAPASCACAITAISAGAQTACNSTNNTYTQAVTVTYVSAPTSGNLVVNGQTFAITSSPQTVTLTGLTANGNAVNVTASFSATPACTLTSNALFTAPVSCSCSITDITAGAQTPCVNTTNTFTQAITVTYSNAPASGNLIVNGQSFPKTSSPQTVILTGLISNGSLNDVSASFSASPSCIYSENNVFTSPAGCQCPTINVAVTTTNVTNCASPNGSATAVATGGVGPYTYTWTPSGSGPTLSNIPSGTYVATATASNGCTGSGSGSVTNTSGVNALVGTVTPVSCFGGNNGVISVTATGGSGTTSYTWSDQGFPSTNASRTNLIAGSYSIIVSNSGCNVVLGPITITQPNALVATAAPATQITCNGLTNGAINVTTTGGNGGNMYSWTNGAGNAEDASGLGVGSYQLTVTDSKGCMATTNNIAITQPSAINVVLNSKKNVTCFGANDGNILITATGGTGTLTYDWNNAPDVEDVLNVGPGTYSLIVTDGNGCTTPASSYTITEPAQLVITVSSSTNVTCFGSNNGSITATVTGGTGVYTNLWTNGAGTSLSPANLAPNSYQLSVTDASGCEATSNVVTISEPTALSATITSTNTTAGSSNGTATVVASGGTAPYTYKWNDALNQTTSAATGLAAGPYTCTITDAKGCIFTKSTEVGTSNAISNLALENLNIFPNPSNGKFTVQFETIKSLNLNVKVFNMIGKVVYTNSYSNVNGVFNNQYDFSTLSSGVYFIEIGSENAKTIQRITISK